jgi:hypothetical protein
MYRPKYFIDVINQKYLCAGKGYNVFKSRVIKED